MRANEHTRQFLRAVMPPGTCIEMMIFRAQYGQGGFITGAERYSATLVGWYDNPDAFVCDAGRLRGISGYLVPNPVDPAFLASSDNKIRKAGKDEGAKDRNVTLLRWLYLDFDADKPGPEMSSTADELAATVANRDRVFREFPEIREHAMWGCSGNGSWALVRLPDYPNDDVHERLVRRTVDFFAENYGADEKTKNPVRLMPLVGTLKCKGSNRPERPWRLATLDSPPTESTGFDLIGWAARNLTEPAPAVAPQGSPGGSPRASASYGGRLSRFAAKALEDEARTLEGASQGGRNDALNRAACALGELIGAGELQESEVRTTLAVAARRIGLEDFEIESTLNSGLTHGMSQPRRLDHVGNGGGPGKPPRDDAKPGKPDDDDAMKEGWEDNPHELARIFRGKLHSHPDGWTLRYWSDEFHSWHGGCYRPVPKNDMRAAVSEVVAEVFDRVWQDQVKKPSEDEKKKPRPIPVTTQLVGHVLQALSGMVSVPKARFPELPCWIEGENMWPVEECVPMKNRIVHLPSLVAGETCTRRPTPGLFAPYVLTYDYDPNPPTPDRWLGMLAECFPDDPESIRALQEWFGLMLVPDTRYQKILALIGPPGCGKGTISRVMQAMVGYSNCASIQFSRFEEKHTLEDVIGKLCLIVPDGRLSSKSDQAAILENLLSISGEDMLTIQRKYISGWTGRLKARITLISNDLPRFTDASSALSRRLLVLKFRRTFEGKEDERLEAKLLGELPGIFRWAVDGWARLRERGRFVQPDSGIGELDMFRELSSPVSQFLQECCKVGENEAAPCGVVYAAWKAWCDQNGHQPGSAPVFGRNLHSVLPSLNTRLVRVGSMRTRRFEGLGLLPPDEFGDAYAGGVGGFEFDEAKPATPF